MKESEWGKCYQNFNCYPKKADLLVRFRKVNQFEKKQQKNNIKRT